MSKANCIINKPSCVYHACMSNHCQFHASGPIHGIKRSCGQPFVDPAKKRRYNLHYRIRKQGFSIITSKRTVFLNQDINPSKSCIKLRDEFGYSIQLQIF